MAEQHDQLYAAVGIHPTDVSAEVIGQLAENIARLADLITHHPKVIAIGETGLDYYWLEDNEQKPDLIAQQQAAFRAQIRLANQTKLPLIIHARDTGETAYWDILELLTAEYEFHRPFILHCVSGPITYIKAALELGAYIGMAGNMTYPNAEYLRDLARLAPTERLLLETDAPFLPPQPYRGKICEPWMIRDTADFVAEELQLDLDQIYTQSRELFQLGSLR